jgi:hypothetical protein
VTPDEAAKRLDTPDRRARRASLDGQARARGTRPFTPADVYPHEGGWESDDEVEEFIRFVRANQDTDVTPA